MRNSSLNITPRSANHVRADMIWLPCIGGQAGSINLNGTAPITKGYPTRVMLGSATSARAGQYVTLSGVGGMTELNGTWKVLDRDGQVLWLDVDSGNFADWTSGGACQHDVIFDRCGNLAPFTLQGTTTGAWANPGFGLTSHSAGLNSLVLTDLPECLDFSDAKFIVAGCTVLQPATPSAIETIISLGRRNTTHGNEGTLSLTFETTNVVLTYRPQTSAQGVNTSSYSTILGTTDRRMVTGLVDIEEGVQYVYLDGRVRDSDTINTTALIGPPVRAAGLCFGGSINASDAIENKFGAAGTPSQGRVKDVFIWKPAATIDAAAIHTAIREYHRTGEWPGNI